MIARIRIPILPNGRDASYLVPDLGQVWRIVSVQATLTTSATAANRNLYLSITPKSYSAQEAISISENQAASLVITHEGRSGAERRAQGSFANSWPIPEIWVGGGDTINLATYNGQVGDTLSDARITVEQVEQARVIEDLT